MAVSFISVTIIIFQVPCGDFGIYDPLRTNKSRVFLCWRHQLDGAANLIGTLAGD